MSEHHDRRIVFQFLQIGLKPVELSFANHRSGIGDIIEHDKVHSLVIESVIKLSEELLVRVTPIKRRIVLSSHEMNRLSFKAPGYVSEFGHPVASLLTILGYVREVAREHHEIRLLIEAIYRHDCLLQCSLRVGIDRRSVEAPMGI